MNSICPNCSSFMKIGNASIHGTLMGFLLVGASQENLYFKAEGEDEIKILDSNSSIKAAYCENCNTCIINHLDGTQVQNVSDSDFKVMTRDNILGLLGIISSREQQLEYQKNYPDVNIVAELMLQWDECFRPDLEDFKKSFNDSELNLLFEFDKERKKLEIQELTTFININNMEYDPTWTNLKSFASRIIKVIEK